MDRDWILPLVESLAVLFCQRIECSGLPEREEITDFLLTRLLGDVLYVDGVRHDG